MKANSVAVLRRFRREKPVASYEQVRVIPLLKDETSLMKEGEQGQYLVTGECRKSSSGDLEILVKKVDKLQEESSDDMGDDNEKEVRVKNSSEVSPS